MFEASVKERGSFVEEMDCLFFPGRSLEEMEQARPGKESCLVVELEVERMELPPRVSIVVSASLCWEFWESKVSVRVRVRGGSSILWAWV
jgi:hypothetical protein